ncbi:transposase [Clostridium vitabionis]|nr:transposase [Clostridium vitabionis]
MVRFCLNSIGRKRILWSDGYFACSIGEVSAATIKKYIESQG